MTTIYPVDCGPHIVSHLKERVRSLKTALELAQQRIDELEGCLGAFDDLDALRGLGLTPQEARLINLLLKRDRASLDQLRQAMYLDDPERMYDAESKVVSVALSHARKKLARLGVDISRGQPRGYKRDIRIAPDQKAALNKLLTGGIQIPHNTAAA